MDQFKRRQQLKNGLQVRLGRGAVETIRNLRGLVPQLEFLGDELGP